ncbi:polysaccharide biosynthesis C-terminal domain-containing protein, partial [Mycolicibacterium hodleri]|uniref:polysaccharide biosynthesis C-terminal domain-containing protein n=1 Tax=Mycolicibacterium hodleri TaxID=49897 RepID=UPI00163C769F
MILILLALLPGIAVNVSTGVCTSTLSALGRPAITAVVTVAAGLFQLALTVTMTYFFGFPGLAIAFAVGVPTAKIVGLWKMQARIHIPLRMYIEGARGPYTVALLSAALVFPVDLITAPHD